MNQHNITIEARFCPEILERILRVIRHRGFHICSMNMNVTENNNINLSLTVSSQRPLELLCSQLTKLADVAGIQVSHQQKEKLRFMNALSAM
ncbi:acetolactate synthase 2 small subunit [Proteus columbae]|uniref:acetolactate synthase 2 small subunit n=1 Tax=Proteus columbae TaxID=1987580 RepID=UPI0018C680C8|nr:acetolactate synthase 2 small subunit [Proteus columbae]MBG6029033.1 acetolactate synthase 2 small subunit [Proteus mirabilis]MBG6049737.1 acetolactate synthase 2 small subunit [Proteus mirabilis]